MCPQGTREPLASLSEVPSGGAPGLRPQGSQVWREEPGVQGRRGAAEAVHLCGRQVTCLRNAHTAGCAEHQQPLQSGSRGACCRIVLSQLEGSGRGALAAYNPGSYEVLSSHLLNVPITDSEAWLAELCRRNEMLGAPASRPATQQHPAQEQRGPTATCPVCLIQGVPASAALCTGRDRG